ncbi:MAG: hypothetical protein KDB03_25150 [Planctomycetales bacterium]|nr:hypothetical protein [Planctomycetales bacterium]
MVANSQPTVKHIQRYIDTLICRFTNVLDLPDVAAAPTRPSEFELGSVDALRRIGNMVIERAEVILRNSDLSIPIATVAPPQETFAFRSSEQATFATFEQPIERAAATLIRQIAECPAGTTLEWLALNQACWIQDIAIRQARVDERLRNSCGQLETQENILRESRELFSGTDMGNTVNQNQQFLNYFQEILQRKFRVNGVVPELIIIHDFDDSLTIDFDEYKHEIPFRNLMTLSRQCLDKGELGRARVRMSLLAGLMSLPALSQLLDVQLRRLASANRFVPGALGLLEASVDGVQHRVLSANFGCHVRANLNGRLSRSPTVTALESNSYRGPEKSLFIVESVIANPHAIHVVVDDGDHRLARAVNRLATQPSVGDAPRLEDLAVLCSRASSDGSKRYPLHDAFQAAGIIHGVHQTDYAPTSELVRVFHEIIETLPGRRIR